MATVAMPHLGESVTEGMIGRWLKQPGERVEKYEPLVEVTTDKVNTEMPSPVAGVLQEITAPEGETVKVGAQIAVIAVAGEGGGDAPSADGEPVAAAVPEPVPAESAAAPAEREVGEMGAAIAPTGVEEPQGDGGERRRFTPVVLRLAEQNGIAPDELNRLRGTGLGGRVSKQDMLKYIETRQPSSRPAPAPRPETVAAQPAVAPPAAPSAPPVAPAPQAPVAPPVAVAASAGDVVPLTPMRKAIAEHMVRSVTTAPHAWTMVEVDMTALVRYRAAKKDEFQRREGFSLSYVPFVIEAAVRALQEFPSLNSSFVEGGVQLRREINVGIAVALEGQQGLIVPVIKGADGRNLVGLARAVQDLATRGRAGKLALDDIQGGTFTVNNTGSFGSILSQPIINQPQAAILTMEAIVKRPVVVTDPATETDMIAIRSMMNMCLSFDHRILDGLTGGQFLASIKRRLEGYAGSAGV